MSNLRANQKGVTLVELLVYLAISSVVIIAATSFLVQTTRVRVAQGDERDAQRAARTVLERMTYVLRNAYGVNVRDGGTTVDVHSLDYTNPGTPGHITTTFTLQGGTMVLSAGGSTVPLAESAMSFSGVHFQQVSSALIVDLTAQKEGATAALHSTIAFRQQ